MLARMNAKNQLILPEKVACAIGQAECSDVEVRDGQIIFTLVRMQCEFCIKLSELDLNEKDIADVVAWAHCRKKSQ